MNTVTSEKDSLASKCMAFCQALASQGQAFNFSLSVGPDFTFALDTVSKAVIKKKASPSTLRRNARRRVEFIAKKHSRARHLGFPVVMKLLPRLQSVTNVNILQLLKRGSSSTFG